MPGVAVQIDASGTGTVTNIDGQYSISARKGDRITFSFIGMTSQTIVVDNRTTINVVMKEEAFALEEAVVIGYGSAKKET